MIRTQFPRLAFTTALVLQLCACGGKTTSDEGSGSTGESGSTPRVAQKILFEFQSLSGNTVKTGQFFTPVPGEEGKIYFLKSDRTNELVPIEQVSKLSFGRLTPENGMACLDLSKEDSDLSGATLVRQDGSETKGCIPAEHVVAFVAPEMDVSGTIDSKDHEHVFDVRERDTISPGGDKERISWAMGTFTRQ